MADESNRSVCNKCNLRFLTEVAEEGKGGKRVCLKCGSTDTRVLLKSELGKKPPPPPVDEDEDEEEETEPAPKRRQAPVSTKKEEPEDEEEEDEEPEEAPRRRAPPISKNPDVQVKGEEIVDAAAKSIRRDLKRREAPSDPVSHKEELEILEKAKELVRKSKTIDEAKDALRQAEELVETAIESGDEKAQKHYEQVASTARAVLLKLKAIEQGDEEESKRPGKGVISRSPDLHPSSPPILDSVSDLEITFTWGQEKYAPFQYGSVEIGAIYMKAKVKPGESPLPVLNHLARLCAQFTEEERARKLQSYVDAHDDLTAKLARKGHKVTRG